MYYNFALDHTFEELAATHFEVISVNQSTYDANWHSMMHYHDFTEIFYCLDGEGHMQTNFGMQPIKKNSLIIVNPYVEHTEHSSIYNPLKYVVIGTRGPELIFPEKMLANDLFLFEDTDLTYFNLIQLILSETRSKQKYTSQIVDYLTNALLLNISNQASSLFSSTQRTKSLSPSVSLAKTYIDNNYSKQITLDTLEQRSHISKYHLSHLFKEEIGLSPINYLMDVRFHHAIELIKSTNYSIVQIAQTVGFYSNHYFSKKFKERYGITPKVFRNQYHEDPDFLEKFDLAE
ncbi:helix-turn-helix transcriptional regulator [Tuanshanicoccus lijuaniae]|uniref:helix-turn-helix domain-containing protein n=1 Tax=Aerococcaceae bacterium zg-1292 TaxID=2774330 RepID=UPI001936254B|nr:helix-turn-helix transcriptional regulator [Aerococcaceae bacterium zg-1292]MBF6626600.1 helix-turn-helix transcriptional regulator [Aerococcaceae bacterium zg-BR9]MBS4455399.1 helix-turn-helix transcriptional regulator [Aerococcaceae bacterium zg-A91]MBS4457359.1 helix-turn-helix transcriptional regulator [Aerococcaceae bacterium zg-BR33]QQA36914.1 helix-turn-helix transcriptional regulator [Aerococcaceae bacterium zg-1292]